MKLNIGWVSRFSRKVRARSWSGHSRSQPVMFWMTRNDPGHYLGHRRVTKTPVTFAGPHSHNLVILWTGTDFHCLKSWFLWRRLCFTVSSQRGSLKSEKNLPKKWKTDVLGEKDMKKRWKIKYQLFNISSI